MRYLILIVLVFMSNGLAYAWNMQLNAPKGWEEISKQKKVRFSNELYQNDEKTGFVTYTKNYMHPPSHSYEPLPSEICNEFKLTIARNEYEPFIIGLYGLKDLEVKVKASDLKNGRNIISSDNVEIRKIGERAVSPKGYRRSSHKYQLIPSILEFNNSGKLRKGYSTSFWITIYVPKNTTAGEYTGNIRILHNEETVKLLRIKINVLPFVLDEIPGKTFAMLYTPTNLSGELELNSRWLLQDMRRHGMTAYSPIAAAWGEPINFDENGDPKVDTLIKHMQWAFEEGFKKPTILNVQKLIRASRPNIQASYDKFDENIDLPNLKKLVNFMEEKRQQGGWPEIIYLPIDEPGCFTKRAGSRRNELALLLLKTLDELGVRGATTVADIIDKKHQRLPKWRDIVGWWDKMRPYCKVRIYLNGYTEGKYNLKDEMEDAKKRGHEVMLYENTSTMGIDPAVSRIYFGYYGWSTGVSGITSWTQPTHNYETINHIWADWKESRQNRELFFKKKLRKIPPSTVCWEMVREGIDDAKYLNLLETLAEKNRTKKIEISSFMNRIRNDVNATEMRKKRPKCDWSGEHFSKIRNDIIHQILNMPN